MHAADQKKGVASMQAVHEKRTNCSKAKGRYIYPMHGNLSARIQDGNRCSKADDSTGL